MNVCWRCEKPKVTGWSVPCAKCGALSCWKCGRAVEDRDQSYCGTCGTLLPGVAPAGAADRAREPWVTPAQPWVASTPTDPLRPATALSPAAALPPAIEAEHERDASGRLSFQVIAVSLVVVFVAAVAAFALWSAGRAEPPPQAAQFGGPSVGASAGGGASTPADDSSSPPTGLSTDSRTAPSVEPPGLADPATVVRAYFAAINDHDYQKAWDLGGRTFATTYAGFAAGFSDTVFDTVTIEAVRGNEVIVAIVALHTDGSTPRFAGIYTVRNGVLVGGNVTRVGG